MRALRTASSGEGSVTPHDKSSDLPRAMRDLAALATLPSIWVDCDVRHSIQNLTDVLRAALRAFTVCVRVELPDGGQFDAAASGGLSNRNDHTRDPAELLDAVEPGSTEPVEILKFNGSGPLTALPQPIFFEGRQIGYFIACYKDDVLPSASDRLLLHVAASQVMLLLQRHIGQEALRSSETRLQSLLKLMPAAVYACDAEGKITFYNSRAAELWGCEPALNDNHQKFCAAYRCWFNGSVLAPENTPMAMAVHEGKSFRNLEPVFERPDGVQVPVLVNIDPILDANGKPAGAINVFQDVTHLKRAEEQLREREQHLRAIVDNTPECVKLVAADGTLLAMNGAGLCMVEAESAEEVIGANIYSVIAPEFRDAFRALNERVCAGGKEHLEFEIIGLKGKRRWMETNAVPIVDPASGQRIQLAVTRDVTDRKRAEESLRESKALLEGQKDAFQAAMRGCSLDESLDVLIRRVIEFTGGRARAAFYIASPDGKALHHIVGMNEHYARAVDGFPISGESAACGLAVHTGQPVITPDVEQDPKWEAYRWLARHHNFRACWSFPVRTRDSAVLGTLAMYFQEPCKPTPREMELAAVVAHAATVIISRHQQSAERERAEQTLRKRGERLQLLSETLAQLISAGDPETIVQELFPKVAAHLGVDTYFNFMVDKAGNALELHSCAGIPDEAAQAIGRLEFGQAICGAVAETRQPIHATDIQHSDYDKGRLVRGFGIQCYACNPLMVGERLLGTLWFASRTRIAFDEDELQFLRIISHYTAVAMDRLKSAAELRESEGRFRAVLDNSTTVIYVKDCDGKYLLINSRYEELFHVAERDLPGKTDFDLFPLEMAQRFRENDLTVIRTGQPLEIEEVAPHDDGPHTYISIKFPLRKLDGSIYGVAGISTDITARKRAEAGSARLAAIVEHSDDAILSTDLDGIIQSWNRGAQQLYGYTAEESIGQSVTLLIPEGRRDEEPGILERIHRGETVENYETLRRRKDGTLIDVSLTVSPIKDAQGHVLGVSKVARDITDKMRAKEELEKTVAERTASLREAIGQMEEFSYTVSHDLRAPLRGMQAYADALLQDFADSLPAEANYYLNRIATNANRLDKMILDVLTFSRIARAELRMEKVGLDKLVRQIVEQYPEMHVPGVQVQIKPLHDVQGHEPSLTQAISNLLNNAVKFVAPGVKPHVCVWSEREAGRVRLWVGDNGIGVKPEYQHRLFSMFERVHPDLKYDGTGVGLAIVRKAVERMGGRAGMESDGVRGSRFWIELRAVDEE